MNGDNGKLLDRALSLGLGLLAFVVYLLTLSVGAFPGRFAQLIAENAGLVPKLSPLQPLWWLLVRVVAWIPVGGLAGRLNLVSAILGAVCIGLFYTVVRQAVGAVIQVTPVNKVRALVAGRLAGVTAAGALAFCIPFWIVSNRAHYATLDMVLLLTVAWLFLQLLETGRIHYSSILALVCGVLTVELATFIILAPLVAFSLVYLLWRRGQLTLRRSLLLVGCALGGLSLYLPATAAFCSTPGHELGEFTGFLGVLWQFWKEQYLLLKRSLPPVGWLLVVVTAVVPWLTALFVARRALNAEGDWTYALLHVVLTGLTLAILLNVQLAPWRLLGLKRLLVTPYILAASAFGYLAAYWYLLPFDWWAGDTHSVVRRAVRNYLGPALAAAAVLTVLVTPFRNVREANGRIGRFTNTYAREVLSCLDGRPWLLTDGVQDNPLRILVHDMGMDVRLLDPRSADKEVYLQHISQWFSEPRLRNATQLGVFSLLQEWLANDPDVEQKLAVMSMPDFWLRAGGTAVPGRTLFMGAKTLEKVDADALFANHEQFWQRFLPVIEDPIAGSDDDRTFMPRYMEWHRLHIRRHLSLVANNLGVLMEDLNARQKAFDAYSAARRIDPDNVSALMNQAVMVENGYAEGKAEGIKKDLEALLADETKRLPIWSLSMHYGYVRIPEAFAHLGWVWARSGQPGMAIAGLRKAMALLPESRQSAVKQVLADVYLMQHADEQSEALYYELLAENPQNVEALIGSARIAARKGELNKASELLQRAESAGATGDNMALEWATMLITAGRNDEARIVLEELAELHPESVRTLTLLAGVCVAQADFAGATHAIERLEKRGQGTVATRVLRGYLATSQNDLATARELFEQALAGNPRSVWLLEQLMNLALSDQRLDVAAKYARRILKTGADHALAHYVVASIQTGEGLYELAEDSLRSSLEVHRAPEALNDLAWLLQRRGEPQEAEVLVREALDLKNTLYQAWDTLGVVLLRMGRLDEAADALDRSLSLYQNDMEVFLHMAEIQLARGATKRAAEIVAMLSEKRSLLSNEMQEQLAEIGRKLLE